MPEERQEREFSRVSQISFSSIYRCPSTKCFILWVRLMMIFIVYNKYIQDWTIIFRVDAECANASRIDFTLYTLRFLHKSQKSLCSQQEADDAWAGGNTLWVGQTDSRLEHPGRDTCGATNESCQLTFVWQPVDAPLVAPAYHHAVDPFHVELPCGLQLSVGRIGVVHYPSEHSCMSWICSSL